MKDELNYELLADVAQVIMGQSPPSSTYNTVGEGLPFYQGKTDFGDMYPTPRVYCTEPSRIAEPDDILISVRAPVGPTNISNQRSCIGRGISAIRAGKNIDRDFLLYFLRFYEPELAKAGTGSTFAAIAREDLETIKIPLPPLTEQKRIASLLARADRLRALRRTAHELGESLLQSVFLEMFGDGKGKWKKEKLGNLCSLIRDGTHVTPTYVPAGIPFVTVKNMVTGKLDFSDTKFISEEEHKYISKVVKPERGDILVSKDGSIGVPCPVETDIEFSIFVSVALLKPIREKINTDFLTYQIGSKAVQDQIQNSIKGIAIRHLHLEDFKRLEIIVPPLSLQEEFAGVVARVESLRGRMGESTRQVEGLFESLLAEAFA
ncbi:MAG: restriction endonuclease subunit S [Chloroflexota bacterium]